MILKLSARPGRAGIVYDFESILKARAGAATLDKRRPWRKTLRMKTMKPR